MKKANKHTVGLMGKEGFLHCPSDFLDIIEGFFKIYLFILCDSLIM